MSAEPTLAGATILFHTNDDDKDGNTHVTVTVRQRDGIIAARIDNNFGHFNDHSNNGPFNLIVFNRSTKAALQDGNATLRIDPNGSDEWHTNVLLDLIFSDASHLGAAVDGLELDDDHRERTFGFNVSSISNP